MSSMLLSVSSAKFQPAAMNVEAAAIDANKTNSNTTHTDYVLAIARVDAATYYLAFLTSSSSCCIESRYFLKAFLPVCVR
jgi:hypothetical protein